MILHLSHNDLDGVGCGILVKAAMPGVRTVYLSYDDLDAAMEDISPEASTVIITDITPSASVVSRLAGERELMVIDHHVSSEPLKRYPFVTHAIGKCATLLTYEKLTADGYDLSRYENFVRCVDDFDLWTLKRTDSLRMNLLFTLLGIERFEKRFFNEPYNGFKPEEVLIISLEEERRNNYITKAMKNLHYFTDKKGLRVAVVFAEMYTSELGNEIIAHGLADYVLIINAQRAKASLRSRKEVDISGIAEQNGGGGHKNAAGFGINTDFNLAKILKEAGITV